MGWLFMRLSCRVSLASQYLEKNLDTNRKLVRYPRGKPAFWMCYRKFQYNNSPWNNSFVGQNQEIILENIYYNPEWTLKKLSFLISCVYFLSLHLSDGIWYLCAAFVSLWKIELAVEQYEWFKRFLWKYTYILQFFWQVCVE